MPGSPSCRRITAGTGSVIAAAGVEVSVVNKVSEGRPHIVDMLKNKEITLIVNTVEEDRRSIEDSWSIRNTALQNKITYYTTIAGAKAACMGLRHLEELRAYDIPDSSRQARGVPLVARHPLSVAPSVSARVRVAVASATTVGR